jgi:hypothetical protein
MSSLTSHPGYATIFVDIASVLPLPVAIDETAFNAAKVSIEEKQQELQDLMQHKTETAQELSTAQGEYKALAVAHELGEADAKQVSAAAKRIAQLDEMLQKLSDSNTKIYSVISVKESALQQLRYRKRAAILDERVNVLKQGSEPCHEKLALLMEKAKECTVLAEEFIKEYARLATSNLVNEELTIPDYTVITENHFYNHKQSLYPLNTIPTITRHEAHEEARKRLKIEYGNRYMHPRDVANYADDLIQNNQYDWCL